MFYKQSTFSRPWIFSKLIQTIFLLLLCLSFVFVMVHKLGSEKDWFWKLKAETIYKVNLLYSLCFSLSPSFPTLNVFHSNSSLQTIIFAMLFERQLVLFEYLVEVDFFCLLFFLFVFATGHIKQLHCQPCCFITTDQIAAPWKSL